MFWFKIKSSTSIYNRFIDPCSGGIKCQNGKQGKLAEPALYAWDGLSATKAEKRSIFFYQFRLLFFELSKTSVLVAYWPVAYKLYCLQFH